MKNFKKLILASLIAGIFINSTYANTTSIWDKIKDKSSRSVSALVAGLRKPDQSPAGIVQQEAIRYKPLLELGFDKKTPQEIALYLQKLRTSQEEKLDQAKKLAPGDQTNKKGYEILNTMLKSLQTLPASLAKLGMVTAGSYLLQEDDEHYTLMKSIKAFEEKLQKLKKNIEGTLEFITAGSKKDMVAILKTIPQKIPR